MWKKIDLSLLMSTRRAESMFDDANIQKLLNHSLFSQLDYWASQKSFRLDLFDYF